MPINVKRESAEIDNSLRKADAIAAARGWGRMLVNDELDKEAKTVEETAKDVLLDFMKLSHKEILAQYKAYMADYDTLQIEPAGDKVRLYRGEWSIWSGFPGNGKTTFIRQMALHFLKAMKSNESVFIATLEQDARWYLVEMAATAAGVDEPNERQLAQFLETYGDRLKIWGMVGLADHKKVLDTILYLSKKHACKHAIIDSLMALDIESNDNEAQRKFANLVSATSRAAGVHIHLVAHPRKPMGPDQAPNVWDVAGSSDLGRVAFNVFFVRRGPDVAGSQEISSVLFHVLKQRTRGHIGEAIGFFYKRQRQFHVDAYATEPTKYLPDTAYTPSGMDDEIPAHMINPDAFKVEPAPYGSKPWEL